jgi:Na+/H+ antiporter NhaD/arsenite permease-like protein
LFLPTVINLYFAFLLLKRFYSNDFHDAELSHSREPMKSHELAVLAKISLNIILVLVGVKIVAAIFATPINLHLTHIALAGCLPILVGSNYRWHILRNIDWHTLLFFAAMFVLMESVWQSGFFQSVIQTMAINIATTETILAVGIVLSQFISNVPIVALYQPMLMQSGVGHAELMALAAGSTIAGNMFILGAASNVIIIQNAERRAKQTITFWEFARVGIPLTVVNVVVYWVFLKFV